MVRQRGSQTAGGAATAAGIPPGWSAYVPEAGFPRRGLEHRRRENKTPGLRLTYRPCCFLLGVSGGSRTAGAAHPPPALRRTGTRHLIGALQSGARRYRGPAVRGPAVSGPGSPGSGGIGARQSGVRRYRGLRCRGPAVRAWRYRVRRYRGLVVRGPAVSGSGRRVWWRWGLVVLVVREFGAGAVWAGRVPGVGLGRGFWGPGW
jgi:hypothetical protein